MLKDGKFITIVMPLNIWYNYKNRKSSLPSQPHNKGI
jgi:hypothetical protein